MKLAQIFEQAQKDGYTHAADQYSGHGRKIGNWQREIASDHNDYRYDGVVGTAKQTGGYPSNEYRFWKKV